MVTMVICTTHQQISSNWTVANNLEKILFELKKTWLISVYSKTLIVIGL